MSERDGGDGEGSARRCTRYLGGFTFCVGSLASAPRRAHVCIHTHTHNYVGASAPCSLTVTVSLLLTDAMPLCVCAWTTHVASGCPAAPARRTSWRCARGAAAAAVGPLHRWTLLWRGGSGTWSGSGSLSTRKLCACEVDGAVILIVIRLLPPGGTVLIRVWRRPDVLGRLHDGCPDGL